MLFCCFCADLCKIFFDPAWRGDHQSAKIHPQLSIMYKEHPQKDLVTINAEVHYPNFAFDSAEVDFGCVLNDTEKRFIVTATNTSSVPVEYQWVFLEDAVSPSSAQPPEDEAELMETSDANGDVTEVATKTALPVAEMFDVLPIRNVVQPGERETFEFVMFGVRDRKMHARAVCEVIGGPVYEFNLSGTGIILTNIL